MTDLRFAKRPEGGYVAELDGPLSVCDQSTFWTPETATAVTYWYDRYTRLWTVYLLDADGAQVGGAQYGATRAEAEAEARFLTRKENR